MAQHAKSSTAAVRRRLIRVATVAVVAIVALSLYQLLWRQHVKRFQVVRQGVLYRVAQPSELGIRYLAKRHKVKTILNLRLEDDYLRRGVLAVGDPQGDVESHFVEDLGVRHLQWAMGREACWPWVSPWQFEEFFRLFDDPSIMPIAVHCVSGRHRTGTVAALFRLEYDRWPIERVLAEMYSFSFGPPILLQEMNLRTYVPRPRPTPREWQEARRAWSDFFRHDPPQDYAELVRQLRASDSPLAVKYHLAGLLARQSVFALPLAARLLDTPDDSGAAEALAAAVECLAGVRAWSVATEGDTSDYIAIDPAPERQPTFADLMSAASLVADLGGPEHQQRLLEWLRAQVAEPEVTPAFRAIAAGISNRYTGNRIPFLAVLLDDTRVMSDTGNVDVRYCDMAVAHLSAVLDERLIGTGSTATAADWDQARQHAKTWLTAHPVLTQASRLQQPPAPTLLR